MEMAEKQTRVAKFLSSLFNKRLTTKLLLRLIARITDRNLIILSNKLLFNSCLFLVQIQFFQVTFDFAHVFFHSLIRLMILDYFSRNV